MKPSQISSAPKKERPSELPFFYFVSLAMVFIAAWSIYSTPGLQEPGRMLPFIVLMIVHIGLYWFAIGLDRNNRFSLIYLIVQGILALVINLIGENMALPYGLFMGLIGLTVGIYGLTRTGMAVITIYLLLSIYCFSRVVGWADTLWWVLGATPVMVFVILYVTLYNRQTEARARAQSLANDLEVANRQLSEYAARVEGLTLTNERQRMARELHDTLSQGLAGLILQLEAVDAHLSENRLERARSIVQQTMLQARATLADARRAIDDLRQSPTNPQDMIQQAAQRFSKDTGIPCQLSMQIEEPIPTALLEPAERAITEALFNIARHAQASQVQVKVISQAADGLKIIVEDNGVGFDPQSMIGKPGHYGLLGIRERSRLAGGTFEIDSKPARGTKIILHLPYSLVTNPDKEPARSEL